MKNVEVFDITEISKKDANATYEIALNEQGKGLFGCRSAGTTFGGHWHEGKSQSKRPETLYLLSGIIELRYKSVNEGNQQKIKIRAPKGLKIYPNTWHQLYAVTNVTFLELNSLEEHLADTKYPE